MGLMSEEELLEHMHRLNKDCRRDELQERAKEEWPRRRDQEGDLARPGREAGARTLPSTYGRTVVQLASQLGIEIVVVAI